MKKSLVAVAALAVAGVASAQSSVTLFGVLDAGVSGYSDKSEDAFGNSVKVNQTKLSNSGETASRIGFRGTEDLGGGLAASFWLEAAINNDTGGGENNGGLRFNRRSTVSLSGAFGEVRLGRDYSPTFWNDTVFDPFGTNGVGSNLVNTATGSDKTRTSNSVGYFLPATLGGFYGQVMYGFNEAIKTDPGSLTPEALNNSQRTGRYVGGRAGYANGPFDIALSYGERTIADDYMLGFTAKFDTVNLGASYDFGVVKLFGEYSHNKLKFDWGSLNGFGLPNPGFNGWLLGASAPVGAGLIKASYSAVDYRNFAEYDMGEPEAYKLALGYVHNLSKRTALYATVAYLKNKNGAGLTVGGPGYYLVDGNSFTPKSSTGYDFGLRHSF
jgi:predicted porin